MPDDHAEHEGWGFARGTNDLLRDLDALTDDALARVRKLTPVSRQLLELLLDGCGTADMAAKTGLTPEQVEEGRAALLAELDVQSTTDAIRIGICADYRQSMDSFVAPD